MSVFLCSCQSKEDLWITKYGSNMDNWPVWITSPESLGKGMELNLIDLDKLHFGDKTVKFKMNEPYQENKLDDTTMSRVQNGFSYLNKRGNWIFSGTFVAPEDLKPISQKIVFDDVLLNELANVKLRFDNSYSWRDAYANMLHGFIDEELWNDLTLVLFGIKNTKDVLQLFYYQEKLIFIYREVN